MDNALPKIDRNPKCAEPSPDESKLTLKIMSINVRHHADFWEERFPLIADEIVRLQPDLIGVQEMSIGVKQTQILLRLIKERDTTGELKYEYFDQLKYGPDMIKGEGVSILSRFPISKKKAIDLGNNRPAVFTRVIPSPGIAIDFYNTHLHNKGEDDVRLAQAQKIVQLMEENYAGNFAFLTGDMNSYDDSGTIKYFIENGGLIDSYKELHGAEATEKDGATCPILLGKTNLPQQPLKRIDFVFAKAPKNAENRLKIVDSIVCLKNFRPEDGLYPSDHLAVMTTFEIQY